MCAQYTAVNVTGQPLSDNCTAVLEQAGFSASGSEVINNVSVLLRAGPSTQLQPVLDNTTRAQGDAAGEARGRP